MSMDLVVPEVGESIREVQIARWIKRQGDWVDKDEEVVEIETEKATVVVPAPASGRLDAILKGEGEFAEVGDTIARLTTPDAAQRSGDGAPSDEQAAAPEIAKRIAKPATSISPAPIAGEVRGGKRKPSVAPRTRRASRPAPDAAVRGRSQPAPQIPETPAPAPRDEAGDRQEELVPMSMLRRTIARRLVQAQQEAALVTTFNEIDMQAVIDLRRQFSESFRAQFDVKLGFMSFFVKAVVEALKRCPELNAQVEDGQIRYRNYYDIGVAIGSDKGLVVPVLKDCQKMSFAQIEQRIDVFAARAAEGRLAPEELEGGTFTISNGGIYGSLLSTPIVNPPQSGILGLHAIQDRPAARDGQVVIRPIMYVALTYDHRIVDGREAVTFLRRVKEVIETPSRLLLEV